MSRRRKSDNQKQGEPLSVRVPRDIRTMLDKEAAKKGETRHWVIIDILKKWYAFMQSKKKSDSMK